MYGKHPVTKYVESIVKPICHSVFDLHFGYNGKIIKNNNKTTYSLKFDTYIGVDAWSTWSESICETYKKCIILTKNIIKNLLSQTTFGAYIFNIKYVNECGLGCGRGQAGYITVSLKKELFEDYNTNPNNFLDVYYYNNPEKLEEVKKADAELKKAQRKYHLTKYNIKIVEGNNESNGNVTLSRPI